MNKRVNLLLIILWMIVIFIMSSFNANSSSNQSNFIVNIISNIFNISNIETLTIIVRDLAHFMEYFILGILMYNYDKNILRIITICILYAISDEVHQIFVPGREFQYSDISIDSLGSIIGILIMKRLSVKKSK